MSSHFKQCLRQKPDYASEGFNSIHLDENNDAELEGTDSESESDSDDDSSESELDFKFRYTAPFTAETIQEKLPDHWYYVPSNVDHNYCKSFSLLEEYCFGESFQSCLQPKTDTRSLPGILKKPNLPISTAKNVNKSVHNENDLKPNFGNVNINAGSPAPFRVLDKNCCSRPFIRDEELRGSSSFCTETKITHKEGSTAMVTPGSYENKPSVKFRRRVSPKSAANFSKPTKSNSTSITDSLNDLKTELVFNKTNNSTGMTDELNNNGYSSIESFKNEGPCVFKSVRKTVTQTSNDYPGPIENCLSENLGKPTEENLSSRLYKLVKDKLTKSTCENRGKVVKNVIAFDVSVKTGRIVLPVNVSDFKSQSVKEELTEDMAANSEKPGLTETIESDIKKSSIGSQEELDRSNVEVSRESDKTEPPFIEVMIDECLGLLPDEERQKLFFDNEKPKRMKAKTKLLSSNVQSEIKTDVNEAVQRRSNRTPVANRRFLNDEFDLARRRFRKAKEENMNEPKSESDSCCGKILEKSFELFNGQSGDNMANQLKTPASSNVEPTVVYVTREIASEQERREEVNNEMSKLRNEIPTSPDEQDPIAQINVLKVSTNVEPTIVSASRSEQDRKKIRASRHMKLEKERRNGIIGEFKKLRNEIPTFCDEQDHITKAKILKVSIEYCKYLKDEASRLFAEKTWLTMEMIKKKYILLALKKKLRKRKTRPEA